MATAKDEFKIELPQVTITIKQNPTAQEVIYVLPSDFSIKNQIVKTEKLDTEQTVLLFDLLRSQGVFGKYDNPSLAKFAHYLTGWSEKCLREDFGTNFRDIRKFKKGKPSDFNYQVLRTVLKEMLVHVEEQISNIENQNIEQPTK